MVTVDSFRTQYPEFSDAALYPDATVDIWIQTGYNFLDAFRWGNLLDLGVSLFVAHNLVFGALNAQSASAGNVPGIARGVIASEGVDKIGLSYDTELASEKGAGHYNFTTYGQRFYHFVRIVGAGPIQILPGVGISSLGQAWAGPVTMFPWWYKQ
jgi:hypothetical protein